MPTGVLILKSPPPDAALLASVSDLVADWGQRSADLRFEPQGAVHASDGVVVYEWIHRADPGLKIQLVMDDVRRARYLQVVAGDPESIALLHTALAKQFSSFTVEELREQALREGEVDPAAYVRLAMALPGHDAEASRMIREALASPDPDIRASAAAAIAHLRWPEFGEDVRRALLVEMNPGIANMLEVISRWYP